MIKGILRTVTTIFICLSVAVMSIEIVAHIWPGTAGVQFEWPIFSTAVVILVLSIFVVSELRHITLKI